MAGKANQVDPAETAGKANQVDPGETAGKANQVDPAEMAGKATQAVETVGVATQVGGMATLSGKLTKIIASGPPDTND